MTANLLKHCNKKALALIKRLMQQYSEKIEYCFIIVKYEKLHYIS